MIIKTTFSTGLAMAALLVCLNVPMAFAVESDLAECPTPRVPYGISVECAHAISERAITQWQQANL